MVRNPLLKKANKLPQSASRNNKNHLSTENTELALNLDNYINNSIKTFCVCIHCLFSFFSHQFKYLEHMAFLQCTAPCFGSVRASRLSLAAGIYRTMLPATLNCFCGLFLQLGRIRVDSLSHCVLLEVDEDHLALGPGENAPRFRSN